MNYTQLLEKIREIFIAQDQYFFDKHVPEFIQDGKFLGDYFNQIAVEPQGEKPPRFYHTFSPFDVISHAAPEYAVVFENGRRLLDIDFTDHVSRRTGAMSAVVLKALGTKSLKGKRVLLLGGGRVATEAARILCSELGLDKLDVITKTGDITNIKTATAQSGLVLEPGSLENIGEYDVLIAHTATTEPILSKEHVTHIKPGAFLASFISSTEHGEFPDDIYDQANANIIIDWAKTLDGAKDLKRALNQGICSERGIVHLKDVLTGQAMMDAEKSYTVYRSVGTPIQNLAVLKLII